MGRGKSGYLGTASVVARRGGAASASRIHPLSSASGLESAPSAERCQELCRAGLDRKGVRQGMVREWAAAGLVPAHADHLPVGVEAAAVRRAAQWLPDELQVPHEGALNPEQYASAVALRLTQAAAANALPQALEKAGADHLRYLAGQDVRVKKVLERFARTPTLDVHEWDSVLRYADTLSYRRPRTADSATPFGAALASVLGSRLAAVAQ